MDMDMRNIYSIQEKIIAALEEQIEKQERIIRAQDETIQGTCPPSPGRRRRSTKH